MTVRISTGLEGIDQVIDGLRLGDNVVWQLDEIEQYKKLANAFARASLINNRTFVYFRFASHDPIYSQYQFGDAIQTYYIDAGEGFESFASQIYKVIADLGKQVFYVFDCLSDLLDNWSSDLMIGNFFRITCPFLFELDTIAYFAIKRGNHSFSTIARIRETTQLLIDAYYMQGKDYIHPLKVWQRYSPTMFLPHFVHETHFEAVSHSSEAAYLFSERYQLVNRSSRQIDYWDKLFEQAEYDSDNHELKRRLSGLLIGRNSRIGDLAEKWLSMPDLMAIKNRQIGTGKIGGKAAGMLIARQIIKPYFDQLQQAAKNDFQLEPHDSFFIGSDLFYTYIVHNDCWKLRMEQKTTKGYLKKASKLREKLLKGTFPPFIQDQFRDMLEYFGQSPIIVRSSSLLEDDFGNAFAGKYESVFCVNQGDFEDRYAMFEDAVRYVYASMMDESALAYRKRRGLAEKDEQMALLVQRVSGSVHESDFFPLMAGVGHSENLYVWQSKQEDQGGVLRLVYGLGTRAVDRVEGDYPALIDLNHPTQFLSEQKSEEGRYTQQYIDILSINENKIMTRRLSDLSRASKQYQLEEVADINWQETNHLQELGLRNRTVWQINFRKVINETDIMSHMKRLMNQIEEAYEYPVDIEFTINKIKNSLYIMNLLQCRPLQTFKNNQEVDISENIDISKSILSLNDGFMGANRKINIEYVIYIVPEQYVLLKEQARYEVARLVGRINHKVNEKKSNFVMLLGPGRWGTSTPSMGIPVQFSEIDGIQILGEISFSSAGMKPELSYGSHFFQDLVEADILYLPIDNDNTETVFNRDSLLSKYNYFKKIFPDYKDYYSVIHVSKYEPGDMIFMSDMQKKQLICYMTK